MTDPSTNSSDPLTLSPQRRRWLMAGVGVTAALAGAGGAWWHSTRKAQKPAAAKTVVPTGGLDDLWQMRFETPDGGQLAMQTLRGKPLLINFWATWCPPCVDELPLLESFYQQNKSKSMQIVGLAADKPEAVRAFLKKLPLTFPIGITDLSGIALSKSWGNQAGGLPFSVMLAANGQVMQRKIGKLNNEDLNIWLGAAS